MTPLRQRMLDELERRNYSPATVRSYLGAVQEFAEHFHCSPEQLGPEHLRRYQLYLLREKKLAPSTVEIRISALRFLYKRTLKRRDLAFDDLPFPKTPYVLPTVLSPDEVTRLIDAAPNRMHRTILMLLYATGIRRSEASLLKVADIDSKRMVIHIRQGKGARDRDVPLTPKLLEALREYWRCKKPRLYLFPSSSGHRGVEQPIADKTVWNVCRRAATRAGLEKKIHPHTLRHSQSGRTEVYVQGFTLDQSKPRGKWQISTAGGELPRWRRDGKELFYHFGNTFYAVDVKTDGASFEAGIPRPLFDAATVPNNTLGGGMPFVVTRDGQRFMVLATPEKVDSAPLEVVVNWR